jgi:hypothetical protein
MESEMNKREDRLGNKKKKEIESTPDDDVCRRELAKEFL